MKRTVLTFGFTSAAVFILLMLGSIPFIIALDHRKADVMGYSSMVLSALIIFFGIRSYREKVGAGRISFGRGLSVGLLITAISCASAAVAFEIVYFGVVPDFGDRVHGLHGRTGPRLRRHAPRRSRRWRARRGCSRGCTTTL